TRGAAPSPGGRPARAGELPLLFTGGRATDGPAERRRQRHGDAARGRAGGRPRGRTHPPRPRARALERGALLGTGARLSHAAFAAANRSRTESAVQRPSASLRGGR